MLRSTPNGFANSRREPHPAAVGGGLSARQAVGRAGWDENAYQATLAKEVKEVIRHQKEVGIDIPSDGEFGKGISWSQYVIERMSGFERRPFQGENSWRRADRTKFAAFYDEMDAKEGMATTMDPVCVGPIEYTGFEAVQRDIANMKNARRHGVTEGFFQVASPSSVIPDRRNEYYKSEDDIMHAIAGAMNAEYKAIVDPGLLVQLDDARLAVTYDRMVPPASLDDYLNWVGKQIELINYSLRGIPRRSRTVSRLLGKLNGPHTTDIPLRDLIDHIYRIKAGCFVIEGGNPPSRSVGREEAAGGGGIGVISHSSDQRRRTSQARVDAQKIPRTHRPRERGWRDDGLRFAQGPFYQVLKR